MGVFSSLRRRFAQQDETPASHPSSPLLHPTSSTNLPTNSEDHLPSVTEGPIQDARDGPIPSPDDAGGAPEKQSKRPSCMCSPPPSGQRGRNLVVCIDGTANQFSEKNTNVVELYSRLDKDAEQLTYYDSGIGTYVRDSKWSPSYWKQVASNTIDMAIAWNFKRIVLSAYQWLSENYQEGDKIFLFGFSRGAYQVRVIAGMIEKVGLLHKGNNNQIPFAYELYVSTTSNQKRADMKAPVQMKTKAGKNTKTTAKQEALCARFKQTLSRPNVRVHFVGAWDTVSSIGFARGPSLPETTTGMTHVCVYRHALALDERRGKFGPEYANGGAGPPTGDDARGNVKEVWFVGSHSDIGGGNITNLDLDQFGAALRWMSYEAITHGLRLSPRQGTWKSFEPDLSVNWFYRALDWLPYRRLSYKDRDDTTHRPHRGQARQVKSGQMIHQSVFESLKDGYRPLACLPDGRTWSDDDHVMLEPDPYSSAVVTISALKIDNEEEKLLSEAHRHALTTLASTEPGRVSLGTAPGAGDALFQALVNEHSHGGEDSEQHQRNIEVLATAVIIIGPEASMGYSGPRPRELVSVLARNPSTANVYKDFIKMFRQIRLCRGHKGSVGSVVFSPDGKRVASSSLDGTVRIWDAQTGETVGGPFVSDADHLQSVAFSSDGTRVFSLWTDNKVRIWDARIWGAQMGETVAGPSAGMGHTDFDSVAFSADGTRIISGADRDKTILVWDARTGETVAGPFPWIGPLLSLAFSPDGTRIASGSYDMAIQIYDAQTGALVAGPFTGHTHYILSVAFSPDGRRVVSSSTDQTIRIWDAQTGETVVGPFAEYTPVWSVAFSPDGRRVASGSSAATVRIWDVRTGEEVVGPLRGHTSDIFSIKYSPDGRLIASGSRDGTVCIWDAEVDEEPED
ncbi:WD40 repeat-like protein [Auriscalpium vulgare]|uniref:WD40 repeat-like protein n=1 Tax=Auriscalpium vulgare TaxID=40419 RepID=A0ACB8RDG9_9AGAM|nr:WD40 repeat-like protein [Auriscalpium vulgare]